MRVALYWAPAASDPLWQLGCAWLGRDAETGAACPQPDVAGIGELTAQPRHYGFHATLRPPMRLATAWDEFRGAARDIARASRPFELPPLRVDTIDGFLALRETAPCPALHSLAQLCVELSDPHRQAPSGEEVTRRRSAGLSAGQETLLQRWGYPYVMEEWFFHLTLTRRLAEEELAPARAAAERFFAPVLRMTRQVEDVCIFTQNGADFRIAERCGFG